MADVAMPHVVSAAARSRWRSQPGKGLMFVVVSVIVTILYLQVFRPALDLDFFVLSGYYPFA